MSLSPHNLNAQPSPPRPVPRFLRRAANVVLHGLWSSFTLYAPNAAFQLLSLADRNPNFLRDPQKIKEALLLAHVLPFLQSEPLIAWPTLIGVVIVIMIAFWLYGRARSAPECQPCPDMEDIKGHVQVLQDDIERLAKKVGDLAAAMLDPETPDDECGL